MRILIIGGTGLISNSITRHLVDQGHEVTHYNRGRTPGLGPAVPTIVGNRAELDEFGAQMRRAGHWDAVLDMVCYRPEEARNILEVFEGRAAQLIVCSTIDVYAKPASCYPITEHEAHAPLNEYARNKSSCERILLEASTSTLPVTILRACHIYGPGSAHRGHVVHTFGAKTTLLDRLRKRKPIIVHGEGSTFWTSCHSDDMAGAFLDAIGNTKAFGKAYHATPDEWLTWNRYYQLVAEAADAPEPVMVHIPVDVLARVVPRRAALVVENLQFNNIFDNTAARRDLGFEARISFRDGMRRTIAWVEATGGFEDSASEPWYDALIAAWRKGAEGIAETLRGVDG